MLDATGSDVRNQRSTSRSPLDDAAVQELLAAAHSVTICRGRSRRTVDPADVALEDLKGRTGNYRAPMILAEGTLLVGFSREALEDLLSD